MSHTVLKQNKLLYYWQGWAALHLRSQAKLKRYQESCYALLADPAIAKEVWRRVNYYNQMSQIKSLPASAVSIDDVMRKRARMGSSYYYDSCYYLRFFPRSLKFLYFMQDGEDIDRPFPVLLKSRLVDSPLQNNIVLKLDFRRLFTTVCDGVFFSAKKNKMVWRGVDYPAHRKRFLKLVATKQGCDIGQVNDSSNSTFKPYLDIAEQLQYKFIVSIEGNCVASNLKWIMSSNSLCLMPRPKFASWFMEDTLQPGVHYVELQEDYANLEELMHYYQKHVSQAEEIIANAQSYVAQFFDKQREDLISMLVLEKYFHCTAQMDSAYAEHFQLQA